MYVVEPLIVIEMQMQSESALCRTNGVIQYVQYMTVHPSAIIRNPAKREELKTDLKICTKTYSIHLLVGIENLYLYLYLYRFTESGTFHI